MKDRMIVVCRWDDFQHRDATRRGRDPIWIKNYTRLLSDDAYLGLSIAQRGILHGLWLLYAASGLRLNYARSRHLLAANKGESRHFLANCEALEQAGFIQLLLDNDRETAGLDKRREERPYAREATVEPDPGKPKCPVCTYEPRHPDTITAHLENVHWLEGAELEHALKGAA